MNGTIAQMAGRMGGLFGKPPIRPQMPQMQAPQMAQGQRRLGLGTRLLGDGWEQRLAAFGGLLQGDTSAVSNYHAQRQQEQALAQQQQMAAQQAQQGRKDSFNDWRMQQDYTRANAEPEQTALQRNYEYLQNMNPVLAQGYLENQARDPNDEWISVTIPGRGTYNGPRSGFPQFGGGAMEFDELPEGYTIRGGGGGDAPGGFPRR